MKEQIQDIDAARHQLIVKSNELIRDSRFSLTLVEQKIVLYILSKIDNTNDKEFQEIEFYIKDFCNICGIDYNNNISHLKGIIDELSDKALWLPIGENNKIAKVRWIEMPCISPNSGTVTVVLNKYLKPYLLDLKSNFTGYEIIAVLAFKSRHSIRFYEYLKSYEYLGSIYISLEDIREMLSLQKEYPNFKDFRRYVVDVALDEINTYSDLEVSYEKITQGRKTVGLKFTIESDPDKDYTAANLALSGRIPSRHKRDAEFKRFTSHE